MTRIFLSYARDDDEVFVRRLYHDLTNAGFEVWFDRVSMPSRQLTFHQEIRDAVTACDRLVLVIGPEAVASDYVAQEWRFAYFEAGKCVNPIVRLDGRSADGSAIDAYALIPEDLRLLHAEDFRDEAHYADHLANLVRQLSEALAPAGKLVAVPELPAHFVAQPDRIRVLRDLLLADLTKPVVVSGAAGRVGLQGMGGIGKSVLASALAHRPEVRRAFPDGIYWVTLGQEPRLEELQRALLDALGNTSVFSGIESGKQKLREALANKAALLVLDDVWDRQHAEAFNVISGCSRLLLTTRDAGLVTALAASENHFQVQLPTAAECEAMLAASAGLPLPLPEEARALIDECGRLPLALALIGGMIRGGVSAAYVLEALREHDLEYLSTNAPAEEQHRSVWRAMDVSLRALPEEQRQRFAELAVFALDRGAPEAAVATLWQDLSPRQGNKLLADLAARSLIEFAPAKAGQPGGHVQLHDLLHNFACGVVEKQYGGMTALHTKLLAAYERECSGGWPTGPNDGYFFENLCAHLIAAGKIDEAYALLTDAPWPQTKCEHKLALSLQSDYEALSAAVSSGGIISQEQRKTLDLIFGAVRLSLNVLLNDPGQFASQMVGRLLPFQNLAAIKRLTDRTAEAAPRPWLRPLHPALHPPGTPLLRTLEGHTDNVTAVALTADGHRAVSASGDMTLKVWDIETGCVLRTLAGHADNIFAVALTADGRRAVSASWDKTLKVWDVETGCVRRTLEGHTDMVLAVALTADGRRAVSASWDKTLKVWDLETGFVLQTLEGHTEGVIAVALTADGRHAVSASFDKTLKIWDLESGCILRTLQGHSDEVRAVALTINGHCAVSASSDRTLKVWDIETGRLLRTLEGHTHGVAAVTLTADGRRAVSASFDKTVKVWDLDTGCVLHTLEGHTEGVDAVALTADGHRAVSASFDKTLKVWDLDSDQELRTLEGHTGDVNAVALTPDGHRAVSTSSDRTLKVWDINSGCILRTLEGHTDGVSAVALTADGRRAVSASLDRTLKVWDLRTGKELHTLAGHSTWVNAVAITPDGRHAVSASEDKTLKVWDLDTGCVLHTLEGHTHQVVAVALTVDGRRAVSTPWHGKILKVWDIETGRLLHTLEGHTREVNAVALTVDGRRAVSASSDKTLKTWDLDSGRVLQTLDGYRYWVTAAAQHQAFEGHTNSVLAVALTADGARAVSASADRTLKVWDIKTGCLLRTLEGHTSAVWDVVLTQDGRRAVSQSGTIIKVWDLETGVLIATFTCDGVACRCALTPSNIIVAGDAGGRVHFLRLEE